MSEPKRPPPSPEALEVAQRLTFVLAEKQVPQKELADRMGVSPATVHGWVHRGEISVTNLLRAIRKLGITPSYFFGIHLGGAA